MRYLILACTLCISVLLFAEKQFTGLILDEKTKEPLAYVNVNFYTLDNDIFQSNTDNDGIFNVIIDQALTYKVVLSKDGYYTKTSLINGFDKLLKHKAPHVSFTLEKRLIDEPNEVVPSDNKVVMTGSGSFNYQNTVSEKITVHHIPDTIEDIGFLDSLPQGYRIIEAKSVEDEVQFETGFNVNLNQKEKPAKVNPRKVKEEYNKKLSIENEEKTNQPIALSNAVSFFENSSVYYSPMKAGLTDDVKLNISQMIGFMKKDPTRTLQLIIYCDGNMEAKFSEFITQLRAERIVGHVMSEGIGFERLDVRIVGNSQLSNGCYQGVECADEDHLQNRRTDLVLTGF